MYKQAGGNILLILRVRSIARMLIHLTYCKTYNHNLSFFLPATKQEAFELYITTNIKKFHIFEKKMKTNSKYFKINFEDILFVAFSTATTSFLTILIEILSKYQETGKFNFELSDFTNAIYIGLTTFLITFLKQLLQNSQGKHFKKE